MPFAMNSDYHNCYPVALLVAEQLKPTLLEALKRVLSRESGKEHFTFCDYGTANCRGSSSVLAHFVVDELRRVDRNRQLSIVFEDQPHNDFRAAFTEVQKALCEKDDETKLFFSSVGRSFFMQCLPSESLHLGVSSLSIHYLSTPKEGYDFPLLFRMKANHTERRVDATTDADRARLAELERIGAEHWETFLLCRAKELVVGGHLVLSMDMAVDVISSDWAELKEVWRSLPDVWWSFADAVQQMVEEGRLTEEEEKAFIVPKYYRTLDEVKLPFSDENSPVCKAGLRLVDVQRIIAKHPSGHNSPWDLPEREARARAKEYCNQMRSFTQTLLSGSLEKSGKRSGEVVKKLVEEIYELVEHKMFEKRWFFQHQVLALVVVEKVR